MKERLLCISDIHGCFDSLKQVMNKVNPTTDDKIVFLGDYIDRGNQVKKVIQYLIDFKQKFPNTILLKGNHEAMYTSTIDGIWDAYNYIRNGGDTTLDDYPRDNNNELLDFIGSLDLYHETEDYIFIHAGIMPGVSFENQKYSNEFEDIILWVRGEFLGSDYDWGKIVVHGHTPFPKVIFNDNIISIDTGCVYEGSRYGNVLSAVDLTNSIVYASDKHKVVDTRIKTMYN